MIWKHRCVLAIPSFVALGQITRLAGCTLQVIVETNGLNIIFVSIVCSTTRSLVQTNAALFYIVIMETHYASKLIVCVIKHRSVLIIVITFMGIHGKNAYYPPVKCVIIVTLYKLKLMEAHTTLPFSFNSLLNYTHFDGKLHYKWTLMQLFERIIWVNCPYFQHRHLAGLYTILYEKYTAPYGWSGSGHNLQWHWAISSLFQINFSTRRKHKIKNSIY